METATRKGKHDEARQSFLRHADETLAADIAKYQNQGTLTRSMGARAKTAQTEIRERIGKGDRAAIDEAQAKLETFQRELWLMSRERKHADNNR